MTKKNGLPCRRCGTSGWYDCGSCIQCSKNKYDSDKRSGALIGKSRRYRETHLEQERERARKYQEKNRDKCRESVMRNYYNNVEKESERKRRYYLENADKVKERDKRWRSENPDKMRAKKQRYRARKDGGGGTFTASEWKDTCNYYGNKCLRCGRDDVKLAADHVLPVSKGGSSDISNMQPLCKSCNSWKRDRHIDYRPDAGIARWIQAKLFG